MFCTYVLGPDIFTNGSLSGYIGRLPTNERVCLFTVVLLSTRTCIPRFPIFLSHEAAICLCLCTCI